MRDSINHWCQRQYHNCQSSSQIRCKHVTCCRNVLPHLNAPILKVWCSASRATGIVGKSDVAPHERRELWGDKFPSSRGATWLTNGRNVRNGSRFEHLIRFCVENTITHGMELKLSCYDHDQDRLLICRVLLYAHSANSSTPTSTTPTHTQKRFYSFDQSRVGKRHYT